MAPRVPEHRSGASPRSNPRSAEGCGSGTPPLPSRSGSRRAVQVGEQIVQIEGHEDRDRDHGGNVQNAHRTSVRTLRRSLTARASCVPRSRSRSTAQRCARDLRPARRTLTAKRPGRALFAAARSAPRPRRPLGRRATGVTPRAGNEPDELVRGGTHGVAGGPRACAAATAPGPFGRRGATPRQRARPGARGAGRRRARSRSPLPSPSRRGRGPLAYASTTIRSSFSTLSPSLYLTSAILQSALASRSSPSSWPR